MNNLKIIHIIIGLLAVAGIVACGDGSGSNATGTTSIRSVGTITGFGSVYVGQTKYESDYADIYRDGESATENDLRIGMVVEVWGTSDDDEGVYRADTIDYDKTLKGPIADIITVDAATKELEILGKSVIVKKGETEFEDTSFENLTIGMFVEVSGYTDSSEAILATYLEKDDDDFDEDKDEIEIEGYLAALDTEAETFQLDNYLIDYSQAEFDDLSPDDLENGLFVEVEGMLTGPDTIKATEIESDRQGYDDGDEVEVEGYIQAVFSDTEFQVHGYCVQITESTELDDGTLDSIQADAWVEVEGLMGNDCLVAHEVEFEDDDNDDDDDDDEEDTDD